MKALRIEIDLATCIRCGHCAQVCPMAILLQNPENKEISVVRPESCIICGQCAAICPTSALEHSDFPPEKLHKIAKEELPTADALELLIRARRSNRAFTDKEIPYGLLVRILQAAHRAPTGSNSQMVEFTLVKSPEKLREISEYTCKIFEIGIRAMKEAAKSIGDGQPDKRILDTIAKIEAVATHPELVLRKATAAIFFHAPQISHNGVADCNLAYQNASLMAEVLGVSQFYTGFVCAAYQQDPNKVLGKILETENTIYAGMALGIPKFRFKKYMDKQPLRFNEV